MFRKFLVLALCLSIPAAAFADFRYQETGRVTGGSLVKMMKVMGAFSKGARQITEPMTSEVYVKGNRMVRISPVSTDIIDLDKETMTHIDHNSKRYTVTTFQQMKEQMEKAAREARENQKDSKGDPNMEASFTAKVRTPGDTKQINGQTAKHAILSLAMQARDKESGQTGAFGIASDMWLAPEVAGYAEVRQFNEKFARKLGTVFGGAMSPALAAMQPGMAKGMGEMAKEMSKLQGVPVSQVMRIGASGDGKPLPAPSEAAIPAGGDDDVKAPSAGEVAENAASDSIANKVGGKLGGMLGGFGRKKKKEEPKQEEQPKAKAASNQPAFTVLMEMQTDMSGFSNAPVDEAKFAIPAGYKQEKK